MRRSPSACIVLLAAQLAGPAGAQTTEARFCGSTCAPTEFWRHREAVHAADQANDCERASPRDIRAATIPLGEGDHAGLVVRFACADTETFAFVVVADLESEPRVVGSFVGWSFWRAHGLDESDRTQFWLQLRPNTTELSLIEWTGDTYAIVGEFDLRDASDVVPGRRPQPVQIGPRGYCSGFPPPSDIRCDSWDHTAQPGYWGP